MAGAEEAASVGEPERTRTYKRPLQKNWWLAHRNYLRYMIREFTPVPMALWLLWFLVEISRLHGGAAGYRPHLSTAFVVFSAVCLVFALYHSVTFLQLTGLIIRVRFGATGRYLTGGVVSGLAFAGWLGASAIIGFFLIWLGR